MNLRKLDLNLLTIFECVYEERSQQRASERLYMSQPAISNAISRLRSLLNDRLFFGNKVLHTTEKADALYLQIHQALDLIRAEFSEQENFDPSTTQRHFTIAIGYGSGYLIGAQILKHMQSEAPFARLIIRSVDPQEEIPRLLREQTIDLAITNRRFNDDMLEHDYYLDFELVIVAKADHPDFKVNPTIAELEQQHYLWVHDSTPASDVAELQQFIRMAEARSSMEVPNVLMLPVILCQTNLVAIMPRAYALSAQKIYPINIYDLPVPQRTNHSLLLWHRSMENDMAHQWIRRCCLDAKEKIKTC